MNALTDRQLQIQSTYGDETYDWFLYATNRPNRVMVEGVLGGSAAEDAGIKPGDLILSYDRERVFRPGPLVQGTLRGSLGDRVDVEVWRQGERVRLSLPRGPLGVRLGRKTSAPRPPRAVADVEVKKGVWHQTLETHSRVACLAAAMSFLKFDAETPS